MRFEYECWKCPKWHETTARGALWGLARGFARPAVSFGKLRLTIPRLFSAVRPPRRVLVGNRGLLWLVPIPGGFGMLIGGTPRIGFHPWEVALWEYGDHLIPPDVWRVRKLMKRYKRGAYANQ